MIKKYIDDKYRFYETFNTETGATIRSGIIDIFGKETKEDPFMRSFPQLIDVGIMGHCTSCHVCPVGCYQGGAQKAQPNMKLEDFKKIVDQCKDKVFQFALGGRGNPNQHENFKEILEYCHENQIKPNYTTSGIDLTDEQIILTKKYCGAVAVSEYYQDFTRNAVKRFLAAGMKTNIHFVLSNSSIDYAIDILQGKYDNLYKGINAFVFLAHKPVGLGSQKEVLNAKDPKVIKFFDLINESIKQKSFKFGIGFDSCSIAGIINMAKNINTQYTDTCEGARFSCYISSDMVMVPCSFDQEHFWGIDLNNYSIQEAWESKKFDAFRNSLSKSCPNCKHRSECMGGCPIKPEIVLCEKENKDQLYINQKIAC